MIGVVKVTAKEAALEKCALMILADQCPPDRKHYLCMELEDGSETACSFCWRNYIRAVLAGAADPYKRDEGGEY